MDRDSLIENYIRRVARELNSVYPGVLPQEKIEEIITRYKSTSMDFESVKESVNNSLNEFKKELSQFGNLERFIERVKNNNLGDFAVLNMGNNKNGIYLSQQQVDLLMITEISSKEELKAYVENICGQFPNKTVEEVIPMLDSIDLESAKRVLFKKYQDSLIDYISNEKIGKIDKLNHKLEMFGISKEDVESYRKYLVTNQSERVIINNILGDIKVKYGEGIVNKINHFMNDDFENIRGVSYEEIESLSKFIDRDKSLDTIIIATGKYNNSMMPTGNSYKFDPYLTDKSYKYCLKHNKHMRYHALFDYAHFELLVKQYLNKDYKDLTEEEIEVLKSHKEEVLADFKYFIEDSFKYIKEYNRPLNDGTMAINEIEVFNELVEKFNSDKTKPYSMIWEKYFGITAHDIMSLFNNIEKPLGVEYIYNETTLSECANKRRAVEKVLYEIEKENPNFLDRFGDQMHLSDEDVLTEEGIENLKDTAVMLNRIQNGQVLVDGEIRSIKPLVTECTEHDFHFRKEFLDKYNQEQDIWNVKRGMQNVINEVYVNNGVTFDRVTYWSLFGQNDHNLCRENKKLVKENKELVRDMYAGLIRSGETFDNYKSLNVNANKEDLFGY